MTAERDAWLSTELDGRYNATMNRMDGELSNKRLRLLSRYHAEPFGTELDGRSKTVTHETFEAAQWTLPTLIRAFLTHPQPFSFQPVSGMDTEAARVETRLVHHTIFQKNRAYELFNAWFLDALINPNAYAKVWWDPKAKPETSIAFNLSQAQMGQLAQKEWINIVDFTPTVVSPLAGQLFDVQYTSTTKGGRLRVQPVPADEVRPSADAKSLNLDDTDVWHRRRMLRSELREEGYPDDLIRQIPAASEWESTEERARRNTDDESYYSGRGLNSLSEALEEVVVNEFFGRVDYDNDGIAEYRRVKYAGPVIFDNDLWDYQPICSLACYPNPHRHVGTSQAETIYHIEREMTTIKRQGFDNLYRTTNPRMIAKSTVDPEQLVNFVPFGVISVSGSVDDVKSEQIIPAIDKVIPMMQMLREEREAITGVSRNTMGLDADTLANATMGAFLKALSQSSQRLEMLMRNFAETGIRDLVLKTHHLMRNHQDVPLTMKMGGQWVDIDPSEWRERDDFEVHVGLGTGSPQELATRGMAMMEILEKAAAEGLADPTAKYRNYTDIARAFGIRDVDNYFVDPTSPQGIQMAQQRAQMQAQQNAEMEAAYQAQLALQDTQNIRKTSVDMAKIAADQANNEAKNDIERQKIELEHMVDIPGGLPGVVRPLRSPGNGSGNASQ